ncbi:MAG: ADP-ribosylglycohydrolase family protein [Desulfobacterales bacterium]|nr:ADP-ribosylglycohydrolase family protein [Desulfobacterales bacterium]
MPFNIKTPANTDKNAQRIGATQAALYGMCIGDALAMPVHWYYNRHALQADYGWVTDYLPPRNPHPDSILWRSSYQALNRRGEILHDQARFWGRRGVHYHQFLRAGENTLNVKIAGVLMDSLIGNNRYDPDDFLRRYIDFMTTPGRHRDTYVEEYHRHFFTNYARGVPPAKCGVAEKHIGGLVGIIPLIVFYAGQPSQAHEAARAHLALTHPGRRMAAAGDLFTRLLSETLQGRSLEGLIHAAIAEQKNPLWGHPFRKWLDLPDDAVIGRHLSPACYVEDALPAVIYLALKYHRDAEGALVANTNLGGDNAARGAVLGALLGAQGGMRAFPRRWVDGLVHPPPPALSAGN